VAGRDADLSAERTIGISGIVEALERGGDLAPAQRGLRFAEPVDGLNRKSAIFEDGRLLGRFRCMDDLRRRRRFRGRRRRVGRGSCARETAASDRQSSNKRLDETRVIDNQDVRKIVTVKGNSLGRRRSVGRSWECRECRGLDFSSWKNEPIEGRSRRLSACNLSVRRTLCRGGGKARSLKMADARGERRLINSRPCAALGHPATRDRAER
jgi:hypothetical protein